MKLKHRKHDGMILVCQNNEDATLLIYGMNEIAGKLTGYEESEIQGRPLTDIVSRKVREAIEEYVEFDEASHSDVAQVLQRVRDFALLDRDGEEIPATCQVIRAEARDRHHWFRVILRDEIHQREKEAFKRILAANFRGHERLDEATGMPDQPSLQKDVEIAHHYAGSKGLQSCYAVFRVDGLRKLNAPEQAAMLRHIGGNLVRNLRNEDVAGRVDEDAIGAVLVDIGPDVARVVLNRLRGQAGAGQDHPISLAYGQITAETGPQISELCAGALEKNPAPASVTEVQAG